MSEQEHDCRRVVAAEGWELVEVLTDNDRGASRYSKGKRPAWAKVKALIAARQVEVVVTWEASRADRDLEAYTQLAKLCRESGVRWSYGGRTFDLTDADDAYRVGLDALDSEREAAKTSKRVCRAVRANAEAGRPHGRRLYGYKRTYDPMTGALVGQGLDETEAAVLHEMARRVLAGEPCAVVARDLNARGHLTAKGAAWDSSTLKRTVLNRHYAGHRVHRGVVIGAAAWPRVFDDDTRARLVALLTDPRRGVQPARERKFLLSGHARCGVCVAPLHRGHDGNKRPVYSCSNGGHVSMAVGALDAYVTALVLARLALPDAAEHLADDTPPPEVTEAHTDVLRLRAQLDDAVSEFMAGRLSAALLGRLEADLETKLKQAEKRQRYAALPSIVGDIAGTDDPAAMWDAFTLEQRAASVKALTAITVKRSERPSGSRGFDQDRVVVEWLR